MFSILLTPLLMLLSVFGLYSLPPQHPPSRPSAIVYPATTSVVKTETTTTPVQKPVVVAVATKEEVRPASSVPAVSPPSQPALVEISPTDFRTDTEARIFVLMNEERSDEGLSTLSADTRLATLARAHSADMLARGYFDHDNPDGCSSSCRANEAGYAWSAIGENIYMTDGYELVAETEATMVVDGWMRSPGHRANILGTKYTHGGVGIATEGEKVYITAVYAKPR